MDRDKKFISSLMVAAANCALYSKDHESFQTLVRESFSQLQEILGESYEIMIVEHQLILNNTPLSDAGIHEQNLLRRLENKNISRIDFLKNVSLSEFRQFAIDISQQGKEMSSFPNIRIGSVDIVLSSIEVEETLPDDLHIDQVKDVFHTLSPFKKSAIRGLDEIVMRFIAALRKEASILKLLCPVKSSSEYTYTHASNVAVLAVFQAEAFGVAQEALHKIGVSALLHDAGKMFIPKEILEKRGSLTDEEFAQVKNHPLYGAAYLAKLDGLTRFAPIIALEHHLKYDCSGYPALSLNGRKQHIFSQIVAIADFFDALRSNRPYRQSMEIQHIISLLRKGSGTDFNPRLVDHFTRLLHAALQQIAEPAGTGP